MQHVGSGPNAGRQKGPHAHSIYVNGGFAYACDLGTDDIFIYRFDAAKGTLTAIQTISTLPPDAANANKNSTAEIFCHPNGKFLYASNRGHDSIAMFRIVGDTNTLEFLGVEPTRAKMPRHFAIAPGGKFLLAGGQASNNVTVFAIDDETGRLTFTGTSVEVPNPMCVAFRP